MCRKKQSLTVLSVLATKALLHTTKTLQCLPSPPANLSSKKIGRAEYLTDANVTLVAPVATPFLG